MRRICAEIQVRCLRRCGEKNLFENCEKKFKKIVIKVLTFGKYGHILLAIKAKDC